MDGTSVFTVVLVLVLVFGAIYLMDPTLFGLLGSKMAAPSGSASGHEGYEDAVEMGAQGSATVGGQAKAKVGGMNGIGAEADGGVQGAMGGAANVGMGMGSASAEGFQNNASAGGEQVGATMGNPNVAGGAADVGAYDGPAQFGNAEAPAGCYPRDQLTPSELLPKDPNSVWAQQNPMGVGSLKGKNFLSAGALIGVNTVGQSMRNANLQLRSEPPNPQMPVSIFNVPTIEPDINRRPLEIG